MKNIIIALFLTISAASSQQAPFQGTPVPHELKPSAAVISKIYSKIDQKKPAAKPPADSAWIFRAPGSGIGTVEVGFEGTQVAYMVFRRGIGGASWKHQEIEAMYQHYRTEKLLDRKVPYSVEIASSINAAIIVRKDFNKEIILKGT